MSNSSVLKKLHDELWDIPKKSKNLPWAMQRKWTFKSHIWMEDGEVLVLDLHDLSVPLARQVVTKTLKTVSQVSSICFITGQGKNSTDGPKILPATMEIAKKQSDKKGWEVHTQPGRVYVVINPEQAPTFVTNSLSRPMVWGIYAFCAILFIIVLSKLFSV